MTKFQFSIKRLIVFTAAISFVFALYAWATRPLPPIPVSPDSKTQKPVISIYRHAGAMNVPAAYFDTYVEFAIWADGNIVWREKSGSPNSQLLHATITPGAIDKIFDKLSRSRLLDEDLKWQFVAPDCDYISIEIRTRNRHMKLASFHEKYGYDVTYDKEHLSLFENWSIIRQSCRELIPNSGLPYRGAMPKPTRGIPQKNAG